MASSQLPRPKAVWPGVLTLVAGLAYGVSPIDLIPDIVPLLGWSDDAAVLLAAVFIAWRFFRGRRQTKAWQTPD